jgi:hypothetical protein
MLIVYASALRTVVARDQRERRLSVHRWFHSANTQGYRSDVVSHHVRVEAGAREALPWRYEGLKMRYLNPQKSEDKRKRERWKENRQDAGRTDDNNQIIHQRAFR